MQNPEHRSQVLTNQAIYLGCDFMKPQDLFSSSR